MDKYTDTDLREALLVVSSAIARCEKAQPKFAAGTSQHTLLKNRLLALHVAQALITGDNGAPYTAEELKRALPPVESIQHKCETAQRKYAPGTVQYARFQKMIDAMAVAKALIADEITGRS